MGRTAAYRAREGMAKNALVVVGQTDRAWPRAAGITSTVGCRSARIDSERRGVDGIWRAAGPLCDRVNHVRGGGPLVGGPTTGDARRIAGRSPARTHCADHGVGVHGACDSARDGATASWPRCDHRCEPLQLRTVHPLGCAMHWGLSLVAERDHHGEHDDLRTGRGTPHRALADSGRRADAATFGLRRRRVVDLPRIWRRRCRDEPSASSDRARGAFRLSGAPKRGTGNARGREARG